MKSYKSSQIFVPGGMPQFTYISRTERRLEQDLGNVKDNLCKLVTLTGSTKSGKTVLANKIFPRSGGEAIWIDGGTIGEENDLWGYILDELGGCEGFEENNQTSKTQSLSGGIEGEVGAFFIKGKGKTATGLTNGSTTGVKRTRVISKRSAAITLLRQSELPLIIDDFHYLKRDFQGDVIRALKPLIFEGHPVIFIAIPHRRYDAVIKPCIDWRTLKCTLSLDA